MSSLIDSHIRLWKEEYIAQLFSIEIAQHITQIPIGLTSKDDHLVWLPESNERFSVKSAYKLRFNIRFGDKDEHDHLRSWKKLWSLKVPSKVYAFLWRACNDGIPTRFNLWKRGINVDLACPIYDEPMKTTAHALTVYPDAKAALSLGGYVTEPVID